MFADDTKCHRALQHPDDNTILQSDLDKITVWRHDWKMSLNQSTQLRSIHFLGRLSNQHAVKKILP